MRATLLESGRPTSCQKTAVVYDVSPEGHVSFGEPMRFAVPIRQLDACRSVEADVRPAVIGPQ